MRLLPVLDLRDVKSPDAARNGVEWEFKVPEGRTANAIDNALRGDSRQAAVQFLGYPRNWTAACLNTLFTAGCGAPKTSSR